jgi:N-acetylmuramoyl-L-alanine amidase
MKTRYIDQLCKTFDDVEIKPEWIIIHCIGYDEKKSLEILTGSDPDLPVSSHYFVPQRHCDEGVYPIFRLMPENKMARHAGVSRWGDIADFNHCSIGIEFASPNYAYAMERNRALNWYHFEKFSDDQINAGIVLIRELIERRQINPANILTHADIAPWRLINNKPQVAKTDPGAFFPMELLAKNGLGLWPAFIRTRQNVLDTSISNTQKLLGQLGYHCGNSGVLDIPAISSIRAFKIHFMPEEYHDDQVSEVINEKMIIGLENLLDGQYKYQIFK